MKPQIKIGLMILVLTELLLTIYFKAKYPAFPAVVIFIAIHIVLVGVCFIIYEIDRDRWLRGRTTKPKIIIQTIIGLTLLFLITGIMHLVVNVPRWIKGKKSIDIMEDW